MINWLLNIFDFSGKRALKRIDSSYTHGYDYAAGALLRGEKRPYDLEVEADISTTFNEDAQSRAWDKGILDAIDKLVLHGVVKDDRLYANWPHGQDEEEGTLHDLGASVRGAARLRLVPTIIGEPDVQT